jgi:UDP-N-acetylglucosamine transferase subunit ALG13
MIFLVVGSQEPFDRLVKIVDSWASDKNKYTVFAQIANANFRPSHLQWVEFLSPAEFEKKFKDAKVIISHAGMGTIINALYHSKPILVMPRLSVFREHRNDHQLATARSFARLGYISVAYNEEEMIQQLQTIENIQPHQPIGPYASLSLLNEIKKFILLKT